MKKLSIRTLAFTLAMVLVLNMIPTVSAFTDLSPWAEEEVFAMEDLGLIPESLLDADLTQGITRLEMCRVAMLSYETLTGTSLPVPEEKPFNDTDDQDVLKAYGAGLVKGKTDGGFYPDETLTRKDFFAFVTQFLTAVGFVFEEEDYADLSQFADADQIPEWVVDLAQLNVGLGIVNGTKINGVLYIDCEGLTTAEQALLMFYRSYKIATEEPAPPAEETEPTEPSEETEPTEPTEETEPTEPTEETDPTEPTEDTTPTEPVPDENYDPSVRFSNAAEWAIAEIEKLDDLEIITDTVAYSSMTGPITRGDMAKIAVRTWKILTFTPIDQDLGTNGQNPFTDTSDPEIIAAYLLGIINGDGNGTFRPNDPLTRQEYFKISVNLLSSVGYMFSDDDKILLDDYVDGEEISEWAEACTRLLIGIGVVKGSTDNSLNPGDIIVTQEALAIFSRIHSFVTTWVTVEDQEDVRDDTTKELTQQIVDMAMFYLGWDYIYGGDKPEDGGFDCAGFCHHIYEQFGFKLALGATSQWNQLPDEIIPRDQLLPGDLIFFAGIDSVPNDFDHVGIYIGDGMMIHASTPSTGVILTDLSEPFYVRHYAGAKRVFH